MGKLQDQEYIVLKPIRYKHPGPMFRQLIRPEDNLFINLDHLEDEDIQLLIKTKTVAPVTAKDTKAVKDALKAAEVAQAEADKQEAEALAVAKKQALEKMLKKAG